jgi:beta-lactamase class A
MAAAYEKIDQGKLKLSSIKSTIHSMISVSSNDAFNSVVRKIGKTYINKWCKTNGYTKTKQYHGLSPSSNSAGLRTSSASNVTTVKDCGKLLESIYKGTCVSKSASKKMLSHMKAQERRWKIPAGIPRGVTIANKTGETDDVTHDAAIVYSKGADYIIVVMARCPGYAWSAASNIPKLSRITYNYFN